MSARKLPCWLVSRFPLPVPLIAMPGKTMRTEPIIPSSIPFQDSIMPVKQPMVVAGASVSILMRRWLMVGSELSHYSLCHGALAPFVYFDTESNLDLSVTYIKQILTSFSSFARDSCEDGEIVTC